LEGELSYGVEVELDVGLHPKHASIAPADTDQGRRFEGWDPVSHVFAGRRPTPVDARRNTTGTPSTNRPARPIVVSAGSSNPHHETLDDGQEDSSPGQRRR